MIELGNVRVDMEKGSVYKNGKDLCLSELIQEIPEILHGNEQMYLTSYEEEENDSQCFLVECIGSGCNCTGYCIDFGMDSILRSNENQRH